MCYGRDLSSQHNIATLLVTYIIFSSTDQAAKSEYSGNGPMRPLYMPFGSLHTLDKMIHWSLKEEEIYKSLGSRRENIYKEIDLITRYITDYEETSGKAFAGATVPLQTSRHRGRLIGSSSVLAHRMIDRYSTAITDLRELLNSNEYQNGSRNAIQVLEIDGVRNPHEEDPNRLQWPQSDDLLVSHVALLELQSFHNLNSDTLFEGTTFDTEFGAFLNISHCALLGIAAIRFRYYFQSIEWLEFTMAYIGWGFNGGDDSEQIDLLKNLLSVAIQQHNRKQIETMVDKVGVFEDLFHFYDGPVSARNNNIYPRWPFRFHLMKKHGRVYGNGTDDITDLVNMLILCSGQEDFQPVQIKSNLHCYLERRRYPYFILNPVKTEELSHHPYIVLFHDVLGEDSIAELYRARGELRVSTVVGLNDAKKSLLVRSSAGATPTWDYIYKIQNKTEMLTGLYTSGLAEGIQTAEYLYGRMYKSHKDPLSPIGSSVDASTKNPSLQLFGDRVATLLYYLDIPVSGGDTSFSEVGIYVRPRRGSAIFWLNMFRNGTVRADVHHAACPVIHGHKTIINQWIRYNPNFQAFPCSLNQFE